jgi:3-deoxy-D-manno-octulosonic-acid transferase|tara:strand:+ start:369 stop:1652 length:1284 start_codon:yes stop_codon:yes gene_type:complete
MILLYRILTVILYPFLIILIYLRIFFKKEDPLRFKEKIFSSGFNAGRRTKSKLVWFHAASMGELKSILPLIEELNKNNNDLEFLITTVTLSSSNLARDELRKFNNAHHRFLPIDIEFLIKKFLLLWKPSAILLVDSEIWPNLILSAKKNKIPLAIINARITTKTFKKWMLIPETAEKIFKSFDLCLTSNLETKKYLSQLKVKNIFYNGNIKLANKINENELNNVNENFLKSNKFWFAASTHNNEENFCLRTHLKLKNELENITTIIAPRHIERVYKIAKLCKNFKLTVQILGKNETIIKNREIIIINSYGVLPSFFKYSKSVFIGKSTLKKLEQSGGQSPIDAAKLGCKIYHGSYVYNFKDIYEILNQNKISTKIENTTELAQNLLLDFKNIDKKNEKFSANINNLGQKILSDTMKNINTFLFNENI